MRIDRKKLRIELVRRELSQAQLANLSGLSRSTISGILSGRSCSVQTAEKVSSALGVPINKLKEVK